MTAWCWIQLVQKRIKSTTESIVTELLKFILLTHVVLAVLSQAGYRITKYTHKGSENDRGPDMCLLQQGLILGSTEKSWQLEGTVRARGWRYPRFLKVRWCWDQSFLEALKVLNWSLPENRRGGEFIIHVSSSYVSLNIGCKLLSRPDTELHGLLVLSTVTALTFLWFRIPQLSWLFLCDATRCDSWLLDHLWSIVRSSEDLEVFSTSLFIKLFPIHICVALSPNVLKVHDTFCSLLTKPFTSKRGNYFLSNLQCVHRCIYTHNEAPICRTGK